MIRPTLSIFIVNYNGAAFIETCIDSVLKSRFDGILDIIVVDNASTDDSLSVLRQYEGQIRVIASPDNLGFSRGNNLASTVARGDTYFLLNNDTILPEDTIQTLYDFLLETPDAGAITPKLLNDDGSLQIPGSIFNYFHFRSEVPVRVSFIAGTAVMLPQHAWQTIGGLDPNLFFYNEDIDMCKMLLKNGFSLYYVPTAELTHFGGLSTRSRKVGSLIEGYRGGLYICYKHYGFIIYTLYRIVLLVDLVPRLLFYLILSTIFKTKRPYLKAYFKIMMISFTHRIFLEPSR